MNEVGCLCASSCPRALVAIDWPSGSPRFCTHLESGLRRWNDLQLLIVQRESNKPDHHLFPGLGAPSNRLCRIRIPFVLTRIIKVSYAFEAASFWGGYRLFEFVARLPVEAVSRHRQDHLRSSVRINQPIFKIFSAKMH